MSVQVLPGIDRLALSKSTKIAGLRVAFPREGVAYDDGLWLGLRFRVEGGLYDVFNRDVWQSAYAVHDNAMRFTYRVKVLRSGIVPRAVAGPLKCVRKATLYWTRNPDLTDDASNAIWAMVVDEEKVPHLFDSEAALKGFLFSFERKLLVPAGSLRRGEADLMVRVEGKWGRHSYIEKGQTSATSEPFRVKVS
jgi:hypothetical protein